MIRAIAANYAQKSCKITTKLLDIRMTEHEYQMQDEKLYQSIRTERIKQRKRLN